VSVFLCEKPCPLPSIHFVYNCDQHRRVEAHKFLVKLLQTFDDDKASEAELESVNKFARIAILECLKIPEIYQCDTLLELEAIKQLENYPGNTNLLRLIKIFASEKLDSYYKFYESNQEYIESIGCCCCCCCCCLGLVLSLSLGCSCFACFCRRVCCGDDVLCCCCCSCGSRVDVVVVCCLLFVVLVLVF